MLLVGRMHPPSGGKPSLGADYLPGVSLSEFTAWIADAHPTLLDIADLAAPSVDRAARWFRGPNEFDQDSAGGRGHSYRSAQVEWTARSVGITTLLGLAGCFAENGPAVTLDVLGGGGLLAYVYRQLMLRRARPARDFITGDLSGHMVAEALKAGLPAIRQPAQKLLVRDETVDAVLMAYGTHHIPPAERPMAFAEATRALRPGGRLVVHDFDERSSVSVWFREVVDRYSPSGHSYRHFSEPEMVQLFADAGYVDVKVHMVFDPFRIVRGSPADATAALARYVRDMYGLRRSGGRAPSCTWVTQQMIRHLRLRQEEIRLNLSRLHRVGVYRCCGSYVAELPRVALVGVGVKP